MLYCDLLPSRRGFFHSPQKILLLPMDTVLPDKGQIGSRCMHEFKLSQNKNRQRKKALYLEKYISDIYNHFVCFKKCYILRIFSDLSDSRTRTDSGAEGRATGEHKHRRNKIATPFPQPSHHSKVIKHEAPMVTVRKEYCTW